MPISPIPPEKEDEVQRARQATGLKVVVVILLIFAVIVGFFLKVLPLPVRIIVAATDVIAAAVLALIIRQKFSRR
jgi:hypothetical protein